MLKTPYISYAELLNLKRVEDIVEKYYNSAAFKRSVNELIGLFTSPFDFFDALAEFYAQNGFDRIGISRDSLYMILLDFAGTLNAKSASGLSGTIKLKGTLNLGCFKELLLADYLENNKPRTPSWAAREPVTKERFDILTEDFIAKNLPEYAGMSVKEIIKRVHFERFYYPERIMLFDNAGKRIIEVKKENDNI